MIRQSTTITAILMMSLALVGCTLTRGSAIVIGAVRQPIDPAQVRLYVDLPAHYEKVALLTADSRNDFASQQNLTDAAIERVKKEAAKLGANGILIDGVGNYEIGASGAIVALNRTSAIGVAGVRTGKQVSGVAILVP